MKVWRDHMSFWLISATLMGLLIALQVALKPWQGTEKKLERLIYLPDAEYLKIVSLGYRELIADLLWIHSIQVMGEKKVSESNGRWLYRSLGGRFSLVVEFGLLVGTMLLVASGGVWWAWGYLVYTAMNGLSAWLILSGRV